MPNFAQRTATSGKSALGLCLVTALLATGLLASTPTAWRELARHKFSGEGGWDYLTVDATARRVYIARANRVIIADADSGAPLGEVAGLDGTHGVVPVPALGRAFATSGKTGELVAFDLASLTVNGRVPVGENPDALLYDASAQRVFVFNGRSKNVAIVDPVKLVVEQTLPLGGKPEFAVSDGAGRVFVNVEDTSELLELRTVPGKPVEVVARHPLAPCKEPTGLAMTAHAERLLVGCSNRMAVIVDGKSGKVLQQFKAGGNVDGTAFDADRHVGYVSAGEGLLTVLKEAHGVFKLVQDLPTVAGARTLAVDAKTGHVLLPSAQFEAPKPAPPGGHVRPGIVPGSFFVLVVGP